MLESLHLLLEDRLGLDVYVPVGLDWWQEEVWSFGRWAWGDDRLARQFLGLDGWVENGDHWAGVDNHYPERPLRGVTLEQFRAARGDWAAVVASVQDNQWGFRRLADEVGARYVLSVGNTGQHVDWSLDPLALVSSETPIHGRGVRYHQEMAGFYSYREPALADPSRVASFVNCLPSSGYWTRVSELREELDGFDFRFHGIDCEHGIVQPQAAIADAMAAAGWGLHCKPGDGFGHVIFGWAAIGRPLIGYAAPYASRLAGPLWADGVTCIDLGSRSIADAARLVREISADRDRYDSMCAAIRARFDELVDSDREALMIRDLLVTAGARGIV